MKTFKDIFAWKKAYNLTMNLYKFTSGFLKCEEFGLKSQIRRASVSIISNIAEGFKKYSKKEKLHFYRMVECSLEEVKCQTMLAKDLDYFNSKDYQLFFECEQETGKLLNGWIKCQV